MSSFKKYMSLIQEATQTNEKNVYNQNPYVSLSLEDVNSGINKQIFTDILNEFKNELIKYEKMKGKQKEFLSYKDEINMSDKQLKIENEIKDKYQPSHLINFRPLPLNYLQKLHKALEEGNVVFADRNSLVFHNLNNDAISSNYYGFFIITIKFVSSMSHFIVKQTDKSGNNFKIISSENNINALISSASKDKDFIDFYNNNKQEIDRNLDDAADPIKIYNMSIKNEEIVFSNKK